MAIGWGIAAAGALGLIGANNQASAATAAANTQAQAAQSAQNQYKLIFKH